MLNTPPTAFVGELEDTFIDVDVPPPAPRGGAGGGDGKLTITGGPQGMSINLGSLFGGSGSGNSRGERRTLRVADARPLLEEAEVERRFPAELVQQEAVRCAEQEGIVYIDEIDKIVNPANAMRHGGSILARVPLLVDAAVGRHAGLILYHRPLQSNLAHDCLLHSMHSMYDLL